MKKEYEGRTEQEAIDKAIRELGLDRDQFDVEIIEKEKKGLFRKGNVKIMVYYGSDEENEISEDDQKDLETKVQKMTDKYIADIDKAVEEKSKEILTV